MIRTRATGAQLIYLTSLSFYIRNPDFLPRKAALRSQVRGTVCRLDVIVDLESNKGMRMRFYGIVIKV